MQDNAPPHVARASQAFLRHHNVQVMDWPSLSPDLNPIEEAFSYYLKHHDELV